MYSIEEFEKEKTKVMNYIMYKKRTIQEVKNKFCNTIQNDLFCDIIEYVKEARVLKWRRLCEKSSKWIHGIKKFIHKRNEI